MGHPHQAAGIYRRTSTRSDNVAQRNAAYSNMPDEHPQNVDHREESGSLQAGAEGLARRSGRGECSRR